MTFDPGFHPEARLELIAEIEHLDAVMPGKGEEFERALFAALDIIST